MLPADAYVPVPVRWRHVAAGDVFVDRAGALWHVTSTWHSDTQLHVSAQRAGRSLSSDVDPDDVVPVLIPVPERDAVELVREHLGGRLLHGRRTAPPED